jgi:hypothetical protein
MANKQKAKPEIPLKDRMAQRKEDYLLRLDTHIDMFNQSLSRNAPVLSQLVSALTVGYALYEGVARWIGAPTWAAIIVGIISAGAIETVGFMAVDEGERLCRRHLLDHPVDCGGGRSVAGAVWCVPWDGGI